MDFVITQSLKPVTNLMVIVTKIVIKFNMIRINYIKNKIVKNHKIFFAQITFITIKYLIKPHFSIIGNLRNYFILVILQDALKSLYNNLMMLV